MAENNGKRVWGFLCYPESCVPNFIDILKSYHVPFLVSPLHSNDVEDDGSLKKPHYHILLRFDGKQSYEQVKNITDSVKGTIPIPIKSFRGMARYHIHLDDKDKYQYKAADEFAYMLDYYDIVTQQSNEWTILDEIIDFIDLEHCIHFVDLVNYSRINNPEWFRYIASKGTYFIKEYQKSLSYKYK